ncbi:MAG TPA: hypothetical protein VLJ61_00050 [Pyrinomonadaceae bacterium]|nr:hypothetical protein [Pyrinomonadaceae bacterium]
MTRQLLEPVTDGGIQNANFFNGRLLTAKDLGTMQDSNRSQHRQLGLGIGDGVIYGLEVELATSSTQTRPILRVSGGLALNRRGSAVALALPNVEVELTREAETLAPDAGLFGECSPASAGDDLSNVGVYVFVASPASVFEGSVPARYSISSDLVDGCGKRFATEGIKFRREHVDLSTLSGVSSATRTLLAGLLAQTDAASLSKLRNVLAHLFFDTEESNGQRRDPFERITDDAGHVNYGALAALRTLGQITDCDVPLALVYWSKDGVQFVDNWAVRRLARRYLDLDALSVLRGYGYERHLQFQTQLQELSEQLSLLGSAQAQSYFQFIPPVGFFPVAGTKSPHGFSPTNFFKQFTTGSASNVTTERFGAILRESFACPEIDLQTKPIFELFNVRDNTSAVNSGSSSQLFDVFVSRSLSGPLSSDGVASALHDAWDVYRGLIQRRAFFLSGTDQDTLASHLTITNAVRDVMDMSNRQYALAASRSLDTPDALAAFKEMYRVQNDLAVLFVQGIPVKDQSGDREAFAKGLSKLLNQTIAGGKPGLLPAVNSNSLPATVDAQNAINFFVANWSGQGVAIGPITLSPGTSAQGLVAVKGVATEHRFTVGNGTDKALTIELEATAAATTGDWSNSTTIMSVGGDEVSEVQLASGASTEVSVMITAPQNALKDEPVVLTLNASVPQFGKTGTAFKTLKVADQVSDAVTSSVEFVGNIGLPATDQAMANADPSTPFSYFYNIRYNAPQNVTSPANILVTVKLTSSNTGEWKVVFGETSAPGGDPLKGEFTEQVQLIPGNTRQIEVMITTPARGGTQDKTASFTVQLDSVGLQPALTPAVSQSKSITVKKS